MGKMVEVSDDLYNWLFEFANNKGLSLDSCYKLTFDNVTHLLHFRNKLLNIWSSFDNQKGYIEFDKVMEDEFFCIYSILIDMPSEFNYDDFMEWQRYRRASPENKELLFRNK